jgi:hypothetical protein
LGEKESERAGAHVSAAHTRRAIVCAFTPKKDPKNDFFIEVRSSHPYNKYRSTGTLSARVQKRGRFTNEHIMWDVPYADEKFSISFVALFRALGWLDNAAIRAAVLYNIAHFFTQPRAVPWAKIEKYLDDSLHHHDSARCRTQVGRTLEGERSLVALFPPFTPQHCLCLCYCRCASDTPMIPVIVWGFGGKRKRTSRRPCERSSHAPCDCLRFYPHQEEAWYYIGERLKSDDSHKYHAQQNTIAAKALVAADDAREKARAEAEAEAAATAAAAQATPMADGQEAPLLGFLERPPVSPAVVRPTATAAAASGGRPPRVPLASRKRTLADLLGDGSAPAGSPGGASAVRSDEDKLKEALQQVERTRAGESCVCKEVLPHIGYAHDVFPEKGMYLAYMTAKLLLFKVRGNTR